MADWPGYFIRQAAEQDREIRAALAQSAPPAAGEVTDAELDEIYEKYCEYPCEGTPVMAVQVGDFNEAARAAIALDRSRRAPVPPADGDRQPSGYAYRYQQFGDSVIRFNGGSEVNGSRPTEAIPYWLGHPPRPIPPADGEVAELVRLLLVEADHDKARDHTIWLTADNMRRIAALLQQGQSAIHRLHRLQQENSRFREPERTILCDLLANGTLLPDPDGKRYGVQPVAEALAARPLLEQVARMGDRIGQHTVAEIMVISDRAAAWLRENPPGQPVAVEPRGCPMPGACACVEPAPPTEGEVAELVEWLHDCANVRMDEGYERPAFKFARAADLLQHLQPPQSVAPLKERPDFVAGYRAGLRDGRLEHEAAADLLERQQPPQPVAVSERLPGASDIRFEFSVFDGEDEEQAGGSAPTYAEALSEGERYLAQYQQDGPHALELRRVEVLPAHALPIPLSENV
jgi:hypothetical protein